MDSPVLSTLTLVKLKVYIDSRLNKYKPVADPGFDLREGMDFVYGKRG